MEPVDIAGTKKWSSIDIYLFSNAQQYSPPRKYHLRAEELQWWGATISYLGRTHYGSGHSTIDIYTTDGRKVNGPLELINGAAYVAVEPPDTFVDTGYEEYLLRASRSWDKRLVQKSYNTDTKDPKLNSSVDDTIKSGENGSPKVGDNATLSMKNQPAKSRQIPQRKPVTCAKPIQKKKPSDPHNATLKRICAETDKIFPCPRKTSLRNEVSNRKRSLVPCSRNVSQEQSMCSKNASQCATRREKSQDSEYHGTPSDIKTSNVVGNLPYSLLSCNDSLEVQKKTQKKRILSDTIPDEVQTVVSLYHNKDRDVTSITSNAESDQTTDISVNQQNDKRNYDLKVLNTENNGAIQQDAVVQETEQINNKGVNDLTVDEINTATTYDNEKNVLPVNNEILKDEEDKNIPSKIPPIENVRENKLENENTTSNNHISDKQATDEYIAYMNRGGLLLLKFNIKVKDCKTIFNRDKSDDTELTSSLINLLKTEKISQVNIDVNFSSELLKSNNGRCIEDKSLQSVINKLYTEDIDHIDSKQPRIIIIKCGCRDYSKGERERDSTICACSDEEETYKTRPKEKLNGIVPCCQCYNETYRTSKDNPQTNFPDTFSTKDHRSSLLKTNGPRVSYLAQKFENTDKVISNNGRSSRNESHTPSVATSRFNDSSILERTIEHPVSEDNNSTSKSLCDKSIQTDWSNVILEARLHEDENYTFHLPSLYVLKHLSYE